MTIERESTWERRQQRAEMRDAVPAVGALIATEVVAASVDLDPDERWWHLVVALLPLAAAGWLAWVLVRTIRRADEYQRRLHLEALAIGFAVTMLIALAGGLLTAVDLGSPRWFLQATFIGGVVSWLAALALLRRR